MRRAEFLEEIQYTQSMYTPGFHLATKIWGGSEINEWAYSARQLPGDVENFFNSSRLFWVIFDQKQMLVVSFGDLL